MDFSSNVLGGSTDTNKHAEAAQEVASTQAAASGDGSLTIASSIPKGLVPWFATWSGEAEHSDRPCPYSGDLPAVWQPDRIGEGTPNLARFHLVRARRMAAERRCQVCGEPMEGSPIFIYPRGAWIPTDQGWRFRLHDYQVHEQCARLAERYCPFLRKEGFKAVPGPESYGMVGESQDGIYPVELTSWEKWGGGTLARLWLTISPFDVAKYLGRHVSAPPGVGRSQWRRFKADAQRRAN